MAPVEFLIFYRSNDKNSTDFLNDYNKKIKDNAAKYGVKIQVINIAQISRAQAMGLQEFIKKNVYPFAFVINGNTKVPYTNIEQIYELIVAAISNAKAALRQRKSPAGNGRTGSGSKSGSSRGYENYDEYGNIDYLELERGKKVSQEEIKNDTMGGGRDIYGGDLQGSMIIPRSVPVQAGNGSGARGPQESYDRDPNGLGYDPSEMEMINRSTTNFDDVDLDLLRHLSSDAMIDPGQEEMMGGSSVDKLNPSGLF